MISLEYLAGLIDGEGCITIFRHKTAKCREDHWSYRPLVQIGMTHKPLVKMLHAQLGGQYKEKKAKDEVRKAYAVWTYRGGKCIDLLKQLEPFLVAKKGEAQLVIQFWNDPQARLIGGTMKRLKGSEREAVKAKREWYRLQLKSMKQIEFGLMWDAGEVGENPERIIPSQAEAQASGVCREHEPAPKGKMCSELGRNAESAAETTAPYRLQSVG